MQRIHAIEGELANDKVKGIYQTVKSNLGTVPNMIKTMANAPVVAEAYLNFWNQLKHSTNLR